MNAKEFLKDKGIHPTEPIYWDLEKTSISLDLLLEEYANVKFNNIDLAGVSGMFSNEELQTIKIDVLHIYDKVSLSEMEVHKRNLILNKIKAKLSGKGCDWKQEKSVYKCKIRIDNKR